MERKHPLARCEACPLVSEPYVPDHIVPGGLLLVGEAPGAQEVKDQQAFSARYDGRINAGYILWEILSQIGVTREHVTTTNIILCRPPGNRDPTAVEVAACNVRLEGLVREADPSTIIALGKNAAKGLLGITSSVDKARNRDWAYQVGDRTYNVRVTYHPAGTIYNPSLFPDLVHDLEYVLKAKPHEKPKVKLVILNNVKQLKTLDAKLGNEIVIDLETTGLERIGNRILCVVIRAIGDPTVYIIPDDVLYADLEAYNKLIASRIQVYHNAMFDVPIQRDNGIPKAKAHKDTMFLHMCVDERRGKHGLKNISTELCGAPDYSSAIEPYVKGANSSYANIPRPILYRYAAYDGWYTGELVPILTERAIEENTLRVHDDILIPVLEPLMALERDGFALDVKYVQDLEETMGSELAAQEKAVIDEHGVINLNSPQQVSALLTRLGLLSAGSSTRAEILEELDAEHPNTPILQQILDYRSVAKELSTYVRGTLKRVWPDGRIRASYLPHGTVTGRLSSRDPNMQNIPRNDRMRNMFYAPEGRTLLHVDYSQHEFRVMAYYAQDPALFKLYKDGRSIHREMATQIYGEGYDAEQYAAAKMVDFGVLYGREEYSLSKQLKCTVAEAAEFINTFFEQMPATLAYREKLTRDVLASGEVETIFGRKRRFPLITPQNVRSVIKETLNFQPQSTANDIVLIASYELFDILPYVRMFPVNLLHDSITWEIDPDYVEEAVSIIVPHMRRRPGELLNTDLPFDVEVKVGKRWGDMHEYAIPALALAS